MHISDSKVQREVLASSYCELSRDRSMDSSSFTRLPPKRVKIL